MQARDLRCGVSPRLLPRYLQIANRVAARDTFRFIAVLQSHEENLPHGE